MAERTCRGPARALIVGVSFGLIGTPFAQPLAQSGGLEPLGFRTEGWTIFPSLVLSAQYNDNIFAVPDDSEDLESDVIFTLSPVVTAQAETQRHAFSLTAGGNIQRYMDQTDQDSNGYNFGADGRWDATRTFDVSSSLGYARTFDDQADPDRSLLEETRRETISIDTFRGDIAAAKEWQRTFANASVGFRRVEYEELVVNFPGGSADINADRDRWSVPLNFRVGYDLARNYDAFVNVGYNIIRFDEPDQNIERDGAGNITGVTEGESQDYDTVSVRVGSNLDFDRLVTGEFSLGAEYRMPDDPTQDNEFGFSFAADLGWSVAPRTTLAFNGSQGFEPASGDDTSGSSLVTRLGLDLSYALSRQISLGTDVSYVRDERTETDRTDDDIAAGVSASYDVNRYAALSAAYRYRQRTSTSAAREFTRNTVLLSVIARY